MNKLEESELIDGRNAGIFWNPPGTEGSVNFGMIFICDMKSGYQESTGRCFMCSDGAVWTCWRKYSDEKIISSLLELTINISIIYGIPIEIVHGEMNKITQYHNLFAYCQQKD